MDEMTSSAFTQRRMSTKRKSPEDDRALRGFSPALLCGRKSCVRLHTNYHFRIVGRQAVRHRTSRRPDPELPHGAGNHRRRGSASTPSAASRREAFTRSGAGDFVYHAALPELREALAATGNEDQLDMLNTIVEGRRMRDIADLVLDLLI